MSSLTHRSPPLSKPVKYIVVTGGVCSSLGKGVTTSSIGAVLRSHGYRITAIKIDPYINEDAGLMSPFEHGEVYVLDDGGEVDLDLGNYERSMDLTLGRENNITTGKVYKKLITKERKGEYLGKTVQVVPHFTAEVMQHIRTTAKTCTDGTSVAPQVCLIEVGGTVGDMESMPFLEALRLMRYQLPSPNDMCIVHLSYVPNMSGQKTKPTQHSVKLLQGMGLQPDLIACRCDEPLERSTAEKISVLCNVSIDNVLSMHTVRTLFDVPSVLASQDIVKKLSRILHFDTDLVPSIHPGVDKPLAAWQQLAAIAHSPLGTVRIAFVGKYLGMGGGGSDTYFSAVKALEHSALSCKCALQLVWLSSEDFDPSADPAVRLAAEQTLLACHGVFLPGGFGDRGIVGMMRAASLARKNKIPFFGVCLGFQISLIEIARTELGWADANSEEFNQKSEHPVLKWMPEIDKTTMGANMRLGSRAVVLTKDSMLWKMYGGADTVMERHRHRYEFNIDHKAQFEALGVRFVGVDDKGERMEGFELDVALHPFFLAVQYHPEFKSRPFSPSPPFLMFMVAATSKGEGVAPALARLLSERAQGHYAVPGQATLST